MFDDGRLTAVAGPDRLTLSTSAAVHGENLRTIAEFDIAVGEEIQFRLTSPSYRPVPAAADAPDTMEVNCGLAGLVALPQSGWQRRMVGGGSALADHP
jgi:hypothetical protein